MSVWVDPQSKLPIQMESSSANEGEPTARVVIRDFVYDSAIDDALFSVAVPNGYSVDESLATSTKPKTEALRLEPGVGVGALRFGATADEVIASLGKPDIREAKAEGDLLDYGSIGLRLEFRNNGGLAVIRCVSQAAYGFSVRTYQGKTDKGIAMGA